MSGEFISPHPDDISKHLKIFIGFVCNDDVHQLSDVINSSIFLLQHCRCSCRAVFQFYNQLFQEYCHEYCFLNSNGNSHLPTATITMANSFLMRFVRAMNSVPSNNGDQHNDYKSDPSPVDLSQDCPQSPGKGSVHQDFEMEDLSLGGALQSSALQNDLNDIMNLLDRQMVKINETLIDLLKQDCSDQSIIYDWALDLATKISNQYNSGVCKGQGENLSLVKTLGFWNQCSAMQVLINILSDSLSKMEASTLISSILKFSPHSDWILATLFTNMSQSECLISYIEHLINNSTSYSAIYILSHVSEHNPYAIINCSKSNIPFMLKLCTNSKPLLDLLAHDVVKKVNVDTLNKLADSHTLDEVQLDILYCLSNAPNALELLLTSFDLAAHPEASELLIQTILNLLRSLVKQLHILIYESSPDSGAANHPLLTMFRDNIDKLISCPGNTSNPALKRIQLKLISLTCINYGSELVTKVFHYLMNESPQHYHINIGNYRNPKANNLLMYLFNVLRVQMSYYDMQNCVTDTLTLPLRKKLSFWCNLMAFMESLESRPMEMQLPKLVFFLHQKSDNSSENVFKTYYLLKILVKIFDNNNNLYLREHYPLCARLVSVYFELLDMMQSVGVRDDSSITVIMDCITVCQKFLKNLARNYALNEYIIGRYILDFIREMAHLFLDQYPEAIYPALNSYMSLLNENMLDSFKSKKNSLIPFYASHRVWKSYRKNETSILNRQLVVDLLQDCVENKSFFATTFVNSLSNELILRDAPWLDEDPKDGQVQHLRMTFETDLHIYRLFDENPMLWNVLEFLSKKRYLRHCLVIIRCIVNVIRTNLFSSTQNEKNILMTRRFISLLANNEILPSVPFIFIPEAVPEKIKPSEMAYVFHDIAKYIRDSNESGNGNEIQIRPYLARLRIIVAHKKPDEVYLKILKNF